MYIVIGGSGFIGSHLVKELTRLGHKVRVFDIRHYPNDEEMAPPEMVIGNILDIKALSSAMEECDTVFHLAANPQLWDKNPENFDQVNHQGTKNVLQVAKKTNIKRLIYTSTESILAKRSWRGPITEETQPVMSELIGPYCRSKFMAEKAVFNEAEKGFPAIVVCPTMPIGPGDRNLTPPGRMIVNFLKLAAEKGQTNRRYILSGHNLTLAEFFSYLSLASGRPAPKIRIPYVVALAWSYIEEYLGKLFGRQPQSSVTGVKLCRRSLSFNGSRTRQQLGYTPRPIGESVRDAVEWHKTFHLS
jgi:dihydroflavonol-4-reductase